MDIPAIMQNLQKFDEFKKSIQSSGQDPKKMLNDLLNSGKVTQEQFKQACELAKLVQSIRGGNL